MRRWKQSLRTFLVVCATGATCCALPSFATADETPASSNQKVAEQIATAIASRQDLSGYDVDIEYADGVCKLRGTVSRPEDAAAIVETVKSLGVARDVVADIGVRSESVQPANFQEAAPAPAPVPQATAQSQVIAPPVAEWRYTGQPSQYQRRFLPPFAWPLKAPYPNYSAVQYPKILHGCEFPYIGPFYPFPEPPLGWRKVTLTWHDGFWLLKFGVAPFGRYHY